jgi:actin cytoskeleton-regulatory complex protein PAN1
LQILRYTDEGGEAQNITDALESAERVLGDVNESIREAESDERLAVLSEDLWIGGEG